MPRDPSSISTASSSRPITARCPVASTNRQAASTLGPIDPAAKGSARRAAGLMLLMACAELRPKLVSTSGTSVRNKRTSAAELSGQKCCCQVLVHHGFNAPQQPVGRPAYWYPASASADDDGTVAQQHADRRHLDQLHGLRRRHHPPPGVAISPDLPSPQAGKSMALCFGIDRTDELGRMLESGIVG